MAFSQAILPAAARLAGVLLVCTLAAQPLQAQEAGDNAAESAGDAGAEEYAACMQAARQDPERALEEARAWLERMAGGSDGEGANDAAARHCEAVALLSLGEFEEAALRLEALVGDLDDAAGELRPDLLAQAGQAWLLAGDEERAEAAQTRALEARPDDVDLLIDRALTRYQAGKAAEAIDDLDHAVELEPENPDIYVYRASAYRALEEDGTDAMAQAASDLERALSLDPDHLEGLLERGNLRRLQDDRDGARADWRQVVDLAPDSPAAEAARSNLERIDEPLPE